MDIDIGELVLRYLQQGREDSASRRILRTAVLLLKSKEWALNEERREWLRKGGQLDSELVHDIASVASPIEIAVMLEEFGYLLSSDCFSALFKQVHESTTDIRSLRALGNAAACYHNWHPGFLSVPPELADRLLSSPDEYARLVGLKVLRRFYREPTRLLKSALAALVHGTNVERCGAAHELICACDDPAHRFLAALDDKSIAELHEKLEAATQHDVDCCTQENAATALRLLGYFEANRSNGPIGPVQANTP